MHSVCRDLALRLQRASTSTAGCRRRTADNALHNSRSDLRPATRIHLGPPNILETTTARKLKLKIRCGKVLALCTKKITLGGVQGVQSPLV